MTRRPSGRKWAAGSEWVQLGEEKVSLRSWLRRFLFTEERLNTKISLLSGGERSRVMLAKILRRGGNLLILDEPTNDLDLATLRVLEEALATFGGCVLAVSHDRYFLNRICTAILAFEGEGRVRYNVGQLRLLPGDARQRGRPGHEPRRPSRKPRPPQAGGKGPKLKWKEERELETHRGNDPRRRVRSHAAGGALRHGWISTRSTAGDLAGHGGSAQSRPLPRG